MPAIPRVRGRMSHRCTRLRRSQQRE